MWERRLLAMVEGRVLQMLWDKGKDGSCSQGELVSGYRAKYGDDRAVNWLPRVLTGMVKKGQVVAIRYRSWWYDRSLSCSLKLVLGRRYPSIIYKTNLTKDQYLKGVLADVREVCFAGSAKQMIEWSLEEGRLHLSLTDIDDIRKMLDFIGSLISEARGQP